MKKGYYIHERTMLNGHGFAGVQKKINEQIKMLSNIAPIEEMILDIRSGKVVTRILKRLPFGPSIFCWERLTNQIVDPAFIYIRKTLFDRGMYNFLKQIRKKYPNVKILLELPTYPYDKELFNSAKNYLMYLNEVFYRNRLHRFIDRIVTFSEDKEIFGIPTICIQNGVNVEDYPIRKAKTDTSEIHLLAVASFQRAHGYERILRGLAEYYNKDGQRRIVVDMVGEGEESILYQQLTESLGLQKNVVFWGAKYNNELTEIFDRADLGLAPFGFYKHGIEISSALKLREYLARGLPVVAGSKQDIFTEETFSYYLEFPNDDSIVDINRIIAFYDRVYNSSEPYEGVIRNIREYAEENVTWERTSQRVLQYIARKRCGDNE